VIFIALHSFHVALTALAVGATLFHIHVLTPHELYSLFASFTFTDTTTIHGSVSVGTYVSVVDVVAVVWNAHHPHTHHVYRSYVKFVHPGSLAVAVNVIGLFSFTGQLFVKLLNVGATLFHVHVLILEQALSND